MIFPEGISFADPGVVEEMTAELIEVHVFRRGFPSRQGVDDGDLVEGVVGPPVRDLDVDGDAADADVEPMAVSGDFKIDLHPLFSDTALENFYDFLFHSGTGQSAVDPDPLVFSEGLSDDWTGLENQISDGCVVHFRR